MTLVNARTGAVLATSVERAATLVSRLRGLLGRAGLAPGSALLIEPCTSIHTFFMRFPIDALFVARDGRVVRAIPDLRPWRATRIYPAAALAIELPAGTLSRTGTTEGDQIRGHDTQLPMPTPALARIAYRVPGSTIARMGSLRLPTPEEALPGRDEPMRVPPRHVVLGTPLLPPFPEGTGRALFALGCFWGAERVFWQVPGVYTTAVGYAGGSTRNPTYREVCSGRTGHAEAVLVVYDPKQVTYAHLLKTFWESHDPTQGMRQGNDVGTQYRSALYATTREQRAAAEASCEAYQAELVRARLGKITTEIAAEPPFYYAEEEHQQYLAKNPGGYCGLGGTGVSCPVGALQR